ncbi:MAG: hypothetical protein IJS82_02680 [Paludibacteraceae bacterium]|nr:hypothetical protein [Paludibacteraceae bacterium]
MLYTQKEITIGSKQKGYINEELIDNTGSEGTITYSSSAVGVATVDEEGVITPVSAGDAIITATWSEGVTTTYTLHVVDGIIAENFSKVVQTGQTTAATWHGDLWDWSVANVRRGVDDTIGIAPRIQATALRSTAGSTIISNEVVEGGVKHIAFDWRQWASGSGNLNMKMYYSADNTSWGEAVASQSVAAVGAAEPHEFNEDIDDGAKGNAYLKLEYTADGGVGILGVMKITPWLLYTTKEATLDARGENALSFKNEDLIDNTEDDVEYSITDFGDIDEEKIAIAADGTVTVADRYQTGDITVQAKWSEVTTTYTLHVIGKASANAYFVNDEETKTLLDLVFNNPVVKATGAGDATYASGNTDVATVDGANVTIVGVGDAVITATIAENDNFQGAVVSYTLHVTAPNFYIAGDFTSWATNKIPVYADSYTKNLEAGSYELKVIDGETWKGFSDLTEEEVIAGLYGNNDNNVCFTLADDGDVTITYDGEVFKLEGDFTPQVVEFGGSWTSDWGDGKITATLAADKKSATAVKSFTLDDDPNNNWYNFKPIINYSWLGCSAGATGVTRSSLTVSGFTTEDNNNHIYFQADKEGEYKFTWVFGSNTFVFTFPATTPTAIDETDVKAKAVKLIENGMLIIEKNGVRYNVMGQAL